MKKMILATLVALSLATVNHSMLAYAGMSNSVAESFEDDLPEIEIEEPAIDVPEEIPEIEETEADAKKQETEEAPAEETEAEEVKESEPEKTEEVAESHEETRTTETEVVPERVSVKEDVDNTPERSSRVIYAHRNVVICDNEPIMTTEAVQETEVETTIFDAPEEEETTVAETETVPVKVPTSSSLPKTADFSDLMIAGVAVMVIVAAAFAVVANRRKRA